MTYTSDKRLCLSADGKVVDCDSPQAASVLVGEGGTLSDEDAKKYGLVAAAAKKVQAEPEAPEQKAVEAAPENKAVTMPAAAKGKA